MNTLGWGPPAWDFLFHVAYDSMIRDAIDSNGQSIKDADGKKLKMCQAYINEYTDFFTIALSRVLPCKWCREAWGLFNRREQCAVVEGCFGSHLDFFIKTMSDKRMDWFMLWLYIMKDKVTNKLIKQEDAKFKSEIEEFKKNNNGKISKSQLENLNLSKNILRIDRTHLTYEQVLRKHADRYQYEKDTPTYFPFFFAIAFNATWTTDENATDPNGKPWNRLTNPETQKHYLDYFKYFPLFMPSYCLRKSFAEHIHLLDDVNSIVNTSHGLARWLHKVFIAANCVPEKLLPRTFSNEPQGQSESCADIATQNTIIARYCRWKVECTKPSDGALKTCRSKTPNRYAPLIENYSE